MGILRKIKRELTLDCVCIKHVIKKTLHPKKYYLLKASVTYKNGTVLHANWGDDINFILTKFLSEKTALYYPNTRLSSLLPVKTYLMVGSTITQFNLKNTVIWGSGIINQNKSKKITAAPTRVCAVRGPRTRNELIKKGINCPEIYGDPVLLFPLFYTPDAKKEFRMGLVPHYQDVDNRFVREIKAWGNVKFIEVSQYSSWHDLIDGICKCDFVISSSLHGIIAAEAYGIPSVWCEFGEYAEGWDFKFRDFYESISKFSVLPCQIGSDTAYEDLKALADRWKPGSFDARRLIEAFPEV